MRQFYFELALAIGCTVRELLQRIDSREISEWAAYYRINPWGQFRADLRMGIQAALFANANSQKGKTFKPSDFMPFIDQHTEPVSSEELKTRIVEAFKMAEGV